MKSCCNDLIRLQVGEICPLCGHAATDANPNAIVAQKPVTAAVSRPVGHALQPTFRFRPEHDAVAGGIAEQNGRKALKADGTYRQRPGKKRRAMPGPEGRRQRRGMVRHPQAA